MSGAQPNQKPVTPILKVTASNFQELTEEFETNMFAVSKKMALEPDPAKTLKLLGEVQGWKDALALLRNRTCQK
jgi:hypothetical protein